MTQKKELSVDATNSSLDFSAGAELFFGVILRAPPEMSHSISIIMSTTISTTEFFCYFVA
jgi:hypothetical protein